MIPLTSPEHSPSPPRTRSLRSASRSAQEIFNEIVYQIPKIKEFTEIIYEDVDPEDGILICQSLVDERVERRAARVNFNAYTRTLRIKVMPTELHDAHQRWAINTIGSWIFDGLLNRQEKKLLCAGVGTTFTGLAGIYQGSYKEPDFFYRADSFPFPSIVIESGWSESFPHLRADKDLWMRGNASVELTILLGWTKTSRGRVQGNMEVWRRDGAGGLIVTEIAIFPPPVPLPLSERIEFTKGQLFGSAIIAGQNPGTVLSFKGSRLREIAEEVIVKRLGMIPA